MSLNGATCEVCGAPATTQTLDTLVMVRPVKDEKGDWWAVHAPKGGYHNRCAAHPHHTEHEQSPEFFDWCKEMDEAKKRGVKL